jgi:hypothetical protein
LAASREVTEVAEMAEQMTTRAAENSAEDVAYKLLFDIIRNERGSSTRAGDRRWFLDTYAECLLAVKYPKERLQK